MQVDQEMLFEIILVRLGTFTFLSDAARLTDALIGRQLSRHQGSPRRRMQDGGQYDQGKNSGRDSKDVQHSE